VASLSQGRTAAAQCGLFTHKSVPVIFEPPCNNSSIKPYMCFSLANICGGWRVRNEMGTIYNENASNGTCENILLNLSN